MFNFDESSVDRGPGEEVRTLSDAQLLAAHCGQGVTRLSGDWESLIKTFPSFGEVRTVVRNSGARHETKGACQSVSMSQKAGLVTKDLDLRLIIENWTFAFARVDGVGNRVRRSLHFFEDTGACVFELFCEPSESNGAFDAVVEAYASPDQSRLQTVKAKQAIPRPRPEDADEAGLISDWRALRDTHAFIPMLMRRKVERTAAMRIAEGEFTRRLNKDAVVDLVRSAQSEEVPFMVFVGNRGAVQIHTGAVSGVSHKAEILRAQSEDFDLRIQLGKLKEAWMVRKPTSDGDVHSVELFDEAGENTLTLYGARKPGVPERDDWRELVSQVGGES